MAYDINKVLNVTKNEVGYIEKETNANLYNKTSNPGDENFNKYAYEFDTKYTTFYNGKKNGYAAWCDIWVDWCFVEAYGETAALSLLGQPKKSYGAGCSWSVKYYKSIGQFYKDPKVGDQIFFKDSKGEPCHTGLVYKVDSTYVYTREGNTSSESGVVANGGAVAEKKYNLNYDRIYGYGRPKYGNQAAFNKVTTNTKKNTSKYSTLVKEWQQAAIKDGYKFPKYGDDGEWGAECEGVAKKALCKKPKIKGLYTNKNLTKFLQKQLGFKDSDVDGKFWNDTYNAVVKYQKKAGFTGNDVDGVVGINTWKKLLNV